MFKLTDNDLPPDLQEMVQCTVAYKDVPENAWIPDGHRWFNTYMEWLAEGNLPELADTIE